MPKYSNEDMIGILKNLSDQLGRKNLSKKDVQTVISVSTVQNRFGNLGNALEAAGLERNDPTAHLRGNSLQIADSDLFTALYQVEIQIGREPGFNDCSAKCQYSVKPYRRRFGNKWADVLAHYRKWKLENEHTLASISTPEAPNLGETNETEMTDDRPTICVPSRATGAGRRKSPAQLYGEPIDFRGLRHAPINEQGVVFVFGMVSRELGFNIESVQQGFPDCEGKYLYDSKKNLWAKARIEFEYKASNFEQHGHDPNQCDFIVCWVNDWPECPVDVIELKTEILRLPSSR